MNLNLLIEEGANIKLEVSPIDLKMFAESIVQQTIMAHKRELETEKEYTEETYLYTKEAREVLGVCDGTLNLWAKRGYLVPIKEGGRNKYAQSDIDRVRTGGRSETAASYSRKGGKK